MLCPFLLLGILRAVSLASAPGPEDETALGLSTCLTPGRRGPWALGAACARCPGFSRLYLRPHMWGFLRVRVKMHYN